MFDNFRASFVYRTNLLLDKVLACVLYGTLFLLIAVSIKLVIHFRSRRQKLKMGVKTELVYSSNEVTQNSASKEKKDSRILKLLNILSFALSWYGYTTLATISAWLWGYRIITFIESVIYMLIVLGIRLAFDYWLIRTIRRVPYMIFAINIIIMYSVGASILTEGCCIAYFQEQFGIYNHIFSTRFIREWQIPVMCPPGPPCHVYATLPEDASSSVFITAQTSKVHTNVTICWQLAKSTKVILDPDASTTSCTSTMRLYIPHIEAIGQRYIHSAYIGNLIPETLYQIQIVYTHDEEDLEKLAEEYDFESMNYHPIARGNISSTKYYKTLSDFSSTSNITIAMGGDSGSNSVARKITSQISNLVPDVVVIGGDTAYDNGLAECYYAWDQLFTMLEIIYEKKGNILVPIVLGVGNHDLGKNSMAKVNISPTPDGPLWYIMLPQHSAVAKDGSLIAAVPELVDRRTYFYTKIGKLLLVSLDSGYQGTLQGPQLAWWQLLNDHHEEYIKMANYHNPIYGARDASPESADPLDGMLIQAGRDYWIPEFDRSKYMSAWENHQHVYKRTFSLRNGSVVNDTDSEVGTIYLGEGCWGAAPDEISLDNSTGLFATFDGDLNHFWIVEIDQNRVEYLAIDVDGKIVDTVSQHILPYLS